MEFQAKDRKIKISKITCFAKSYVYKGWYVCETYSCIEYKTKSEQNFKSIFEFVKMWQRRYLAETVFLLFGP